MCADLEPVAGQILPVCDAMDDDVHDYDDDDGGVGGGNGDDGGGGGGGGGDDDDDEVDVGDDVDDDFDDDDDDDDVHDDDVADHLATSSPYARYVTNLNFGSAIRYALAVLGMVSPSLLRDVADRNFAALQQELFNQVLLPDPNDVYQSLLTRYDKRL